MITTFTFRVRNIPAALYKAMGGFATNGVNMTKLESYMVGGTFTATEFYADIEGHPEDPNVALALEELRYFTSEVRILGVYPADRERGQGQVLTVVTVLDPRTKLGQALLEPGLHPALGQPHRVDEQPRRQRLRLDLEIGPQPAATGRQDHHLDLDHPVDGRAVDHHRQALARRHIRDTERYLARLAPEMAADAPFGPDAAVRRARRSLHLDPVADRLALPGRGVDQRGEDNGGRHFKIGLRRQLHRRSSDCVRIISPG
jgi:hypothetical protein